MLYQDGFEKRLSRTKTSKNYFLKSVQKHSSKMVFLKLSQRENTCVAVSFSNEDAVITVGNFLKKRLQHMRFPVNISKFLRTDFFYRIPPVAVVVSLME